MGISLSSRKNHLRRTRLQARQQLDRERDKGEYAFAARRRTIERIGLPQVRDYRLAQLAQEEKAWGEHLELAAEVSPELVPLLVIRLVSP